MRIIQVKSFSIVMVALILGVVTSSAFAQLKFGYVNSNRILESYKEAIDVRKQLQELNTQWEQEALNMQKEVKELNEQLESQSLLLSEERKRTKQQDIQNLYLKYQQFIQEKFGPQGALVKKEVEFLEPVYKKINSAIKKIGEADSYDYIFDVVAGNILYASESQTDLTERLLGDLNKGLQAQSSTGGSK